MKGAVNKKGDAATNWFVGFLIILIGGGLVIWIYFYAGGRAGTALGNIVPSDLTAASAVCNEITNEVVRASFCGDFKKVGTRTYSTCGFATLHDTLSDAGKAVICDATNNALLVQNCKGLVNAALSTGKVVLSSSQKLVILSSSANKIEVSQESDCDRLNGAQYGVFAAAVANPTTVNCPGTWVTPGTPRCPVGSTEQTATYADATTNTGKICCKTTPPVTP